MVETYSEFSRNSDNDAISCQEKLFRVNLKKKLRIMLLISYTYFWIVGKGTFRFLTSSKLKPLYMAIRCRPKIERIRVSGSNSSRRSSRSLQSSGNSLASSGNQINFFVLSVVVPGESVRLFMDGMFIRPMLSISSRGRQLGGPVLLIGILGRIFNVGYCKGEIHKC